MSHQRIPAWPPFRCRFQSFSHACFDFVLSSRPRLVAASFSGSAPATTVTSAVALHNPAQP